jgi:ribosomal protein S18 acetylase RimI-like enzyme
VWTAKVDGIPHAMFGLIVTSILGGEGTPWFLGSDETYRHPREMLVMGRRLMARWLDSRLSNVVAQQNHRAIRMLRAWGFTVGGHEKMIGGVAFLDFWMER